LSRVMGNYHARFLEGKAPARGLTYSTKRMRELLACISVNFCNIAQKYHLSVREQVITSEKV